MVNELKLVRDNSGKTFTSGSETWCVLVTSKYITYRRVEDNAMVEPE